MKRAPIFLWALLLYLLPVASALAAPPDSVDNLSPIPLNFLGEHIPIGQDSVNGQEVPVYNFTSWTKKPLVLSGDLYCIANATFWMEPAARNARNRLVQMIAGAPVGDPEVATVLLTEASSQAASKKQDEGLCVGSSPDQAISATPTGRVWIAKLVNGYFAIVEMPWVNEDREPSLLYFGKMLTNEELRRIQVETIAELRLPRPILTKQ